MCDRVSQKFDGGRLIKSRLGHNGFLEMLVLGEMRLLIEPLKKLLTRNLQTVSQPFSDLKTLDCLIRTSSLAERMG